jgi:hypothetical protein
MMKNLVEAVLKVMEEVKGIDKSMTVGSGNYSYQGVPDQAVKKVIGESMKKNGLVLLPISIEPTTQIDRWEENGKQKQSVFTEVKTKYLLLHTSGEQLEVAGYGQGVDSQDKSAGKATTYALKYALLYLFLVPTGKIDDTDTKNSNSISNGTKIPLPDMVKAKRYIESGGGTLEKIKVKYTLTPEQEKDLSKV